MKYTLKKLSLFALGFLMFSLNSMDIEVKEMAIENAKTEEDFKQWLHQEDAKLWKKLEEVYGITETGCNELKNLVKAEYEALVEEMIQNDRINQELPEPIKAAIHQALQDFDLHNDALKIVPFAKINPAGSTDSVLFINQNCLPAPMPFDVKKYLIALAIAMALHKDHSTDFLLAKIRQFNAIVKPDLLQEVMEQYELMKNVRADMQVMLLGKNYREAQNLYVKIVNDKQANPDKEDIARLIIGQCMSKVLDKKV